MAAQQAASFFFTPSTLPGGRWEERGRGRGRNQLQRSLMKGNEEKIAQDACCFGERSAK